MKVNFCCDKFKKAIEDKFIEVLYFEESNSFFIRGVPNLVNDGDDCYDDMTDSKEILYCPFCGEKLNKKEEIK